ncbi:MAG: hypothetical protein EHM28_01190 [Spirochaetaceae bacterium]|nr:MAG: hypothetical protein EHM28_01190 [Spirochaetaceae bacterium]
MQTISCDSCRKVINEAMRDINYVTILDRTMCTPCKEVFDKRVTQTMFSKKKYVFLDQKKLLSDTLYKTCK